MTKIHEEFIQEEKLNSIKNLSTSLKGELTVVLSEKTQKKSTVRN